MLNSEDPDEMLHNAAFHQGLRQKRSSKKEKQNYLEIITIQSKVYSTKTEESNSALTLSLPMSQFGDQRQSVNVAIWRLGHMVCFSDVYYPILRHIGNVPLTIFQLNRDGSSWVEPVLS